MKKQFLRALAFVLVLAMSLSMTVMAADTSTTWIELSLEDDEGGENGESYRVRISEESSHYLTKDTLLLPEVVALINKMYDPKDSSTPMWDFDCWDMKEVMDEGLEAYIDGIDAWGAYLDKHYEDVAHAYGDVTLKDLLKSRTSTLGDLVTSIPHQISYTNEVEGSSKYGVTYTLTVIRHIDSLPELGFDDHSHAAYINGYPDGTVRPEATITRAEAASIFYRAMTEESRETYRSELNIFSDVADDAWYKDAVCTMAAAGIIKGYEDGTFHPDANITRAEIAAMVTRFTERGRSSETAAYKGIFTDVKEGDWYATAVELANELGWAQGSDGLYRPNDNMTRAEVMTMVNRILQRDVKEDGMLEGMITWTDNTADKWYYEAVQEATNAHTYTRTHEQVPNQAFNYETWVELIKAAE